MKQIRKFKELYDKHIEAKRPQSAFVEDCRNAFGVTLTEDGLKKCNDKQVLDPMKVSFQEIAYEMLGRDYGQILQNRIQEVNGGPVMPSSFVNINGFDATAFGLLDALILQGFDKPTWLWPKFVNVEPTRTNGGKNVRAYMDQTTGVDLQIGEEAPSAGLKQGWVKRQPNIRRAHKLLITLESILYDWTDTIQEEAVGSGVKIAYEIEKHVADAVLGVTNTYERDGTSGNTYLTAKGTAPMNYKNSESNALTNYQAVQTAMATLMANTDPYSGIPIVVDINKMKVLVPVNKLYDTRAIVRATSVMFGTDLTSAFTAGSTPNPLEANFEILASPVWDARNTAGSKSYFSWLACQGEQAFGYRQLVPFNTVQLTLGPKEVASNIALGVYCQEIGAVYVKEPRYTYIGTTQ